LRQMPIHTQRAQLLDPLQHFLDLPGGMLEHDPLQNRWSAGKIDISGKQLPIL
jgi:hypothetical protein